MTRQQALIEQAQIQRMIEAERDKQTLTEAERRKVLETSLVCRHRQASTIVMVGEFTLQLCPDCMKKIMLAIGLRLDNVEVDTCPARKS
jgi:hypothetical protein